MPRSGEQWHATEKAQKPSELTGRVQRFFPDIKMGTIKSDSLDSYAFHFSDWAVLDIVPVAGQRVTFEVRGNRAANIKPYSK